MLNPGAWALQSSCAVLELSEKKAAGGVKFSLLLVRMSEVWHPALDSGPSAQVGQDLSAGMLALSGVCCPGGLSQVEWWHLHEALSQPHNPGCPKEWLSSLCGSVVVALQRGQVTPTEQHGRRNSQRIHSSKGKRISYNRLLSWSGCAVLGQGLLSVLWEESMLKTSENVFILVQIWLCCREEPTHYNVLCISLSMNSQGSDVPLVGLRWFSR